jgi:phosphoadenosine phosphosulfate reductase
MYSYEWDVETGGLKLNTSPLSFSKEPRPVYYKELDILGFDKHWNYEKNDTYPYMWAEANNYWYRGRLVAKTKGGSSYLAPELILVEDPEPGNMPLRFVDVPGMVEKNRELLEILTQDTIKKVYNTYVEYEDKVDVFYVAFSGGKDSIVTLDIVQRALPHNKFKVLFGDTGMEFPDTYDVVNKIKDFCENEEIEFLTSKSDLEPEFTWKKFGPPAQTMRWCCSVHKTAPQINLLRKYTNNPKFRGMAFTGVRGDESASRSEYEAVSLGEKVRGQYSCHPLLEWNSAELFVYIYSRDLIINEAYKKGNSRAGCLVCPLAANKNMFFKEQSYSSVSDGRPSTTMFNKIILDTTSKELSSEAAINEFMNIGGWKARRSGKELSFAQNYSVESFEKGIFKIQLLRELTSWKEWLKTIGDITYIDDMTVEVIYQEKPYIIKLYNNSDFTEFVVNIGTNTKTDIYFMSDFKTVMRKSAYCIGCRVCEANCPNGYITMESENVHIDNKCVKCKKCHEVFHGCLVANSLRLPKGENKMGSIDRYGNMGIEYKWVKQYFEKGDDFWDSPHGLGTNMVKYLKSFLNDSDITTKTKLNYFGEKVIDLGVESIESWALMICNLAYTSEFNWWIKNTKQNCTYTPDSLLLMLGDEMSKNSKNHIVSAYKNIFISIKQIGEELGMGVCDYELKNNKRYLNTITRSNWKNPDPRVILYSLYKFAENCGDYYQFTLTRLLNHEIDSDGVSPTEIFGFDREQMEKILNGLSINYPEFIAASFTLDLDNITLRNDKTSKDVLEIF